MLSVIGCVALATWAIAATPQPTTTVTVKRLCPTCSKKIVQKLKQMPQVSQVTVDVEHRMFVVQATPESALSPRQIWETVERGGEQPVKLEGPSGAFTEKPKF
jgi:Cu+-exporting ATPase